MSTNPSFTIIVIGGGVAGLAASIGLRRKGHKVLILESSTTLQTLGGSLLIPPNAARVLDSYGIWEKFKESETVPSGNTTFRYQDGKVLEGVEYAAMEGTFGYAVMAPSRAKYQRLLYDAAIELGVEVKLSSRIKCLDETTPSVTLTSGEKIKGDIIIGADGIKSKVRSEILREEDVKPLPESIAYQCNISGDDMRGDPVTAPLMEEGAIHSWYGPSRQMICGPDSSSSVYRMTLIFYPNSTLSSDDILAANSSSSYRLGSIDSLRECVKDFEPRVRKFASLVKPEDCFLWKIAHLPKLESWISKSGKVAILGDAAHAMVPHLGAGAATAVEDGAVLAECLSYAQSTSDIPKSLQTYEKIRRPRAERIQATALITGQYKVMADGPAQVKRDEKMAQRMDKANPRYEYWKAGGGLEWLYGYDFMKEVGRESGDSTSEIVVKYSSSYKL
ncbi:salicylate hydroxylase [Rhexocercosporidium sp. MPI-PUGE-AT-0058]|nr:salicylate hydroxylase [Rhexocercosporidium sp. MPI-PUGE-AT-0058]